MTAMMPLEMNGQNTGHTSLNLQSRTPKVRRKPEIWSIETPDSSLGSFAQASESGLPSHNSMRSVQCLIWHNIKNIVNVPEQEEVRAVLGTDLIEKNEVLFSEAEALEEILRDVLINIDHQLAAQNIFQAPSRSFLEDEIRMMLTALHRKTSPLPIKATNNDLESQTTNDPEFPAGNPSDETPSDPTLSFYGISERIDSSEAEGRDQSSRGASPSRSTDSGFQDSGLASAHLLKKGKGLWPSSLRGTPTSPLSRPGTSSSVAGGSSRGVSRGSQSVREGGALREKLEYKDPKEREIMDYVMGDRPSSSGRSRTPSWKAESRAVGSRPGTGSSRGSASLELKAAVDDVADKLSVSRIDSVVGHLRKLLAEEHAALLEDVAFLQQSLEEEVEMSAQVTKPPPSTADMRMFSAKLERELQDTTRRQVQNERLESLLSTPCNVPSPSPSPFSTPRSTHTPLSNLQPRQKPNPVMRTSPFSALVSPSSALKKTLSPTTPSSSTSRKPSSTTPASSSTFKISSLTPSCALVSPSSTLESPSLTTPPSSSTLRKPSSATPPSSSTLRNLSVSTPPSFSSSKIPITSTPPSSSLFWKSHKAVLAPIEARVDVAQSRKPTCMAVNGRDKTSNQPVDKSCLEKTSEHVSVVPLEFRCDHSSPSEVPSHPSLPTHSSRSYLSGESNGAAGQTSIDNSADNGMTPKGGRDHMGSKGVRSNLGNGMEVTRRAVCTVCNTALSSCVCLGFEPRLRNFGMDLSVEQRASLRGIDGGGSHKRLAQSPRGLRDRTPQGSTKSF